MSKRICPIELPLLAGAMLLASCSVKEDRAQCLCAVEIGIESFAKVAPAVHAEIVSGTGVLVNRTVETAAENRFQADIPQEAVTLLLYSAGPWTIRNGNLLLTEEGHQADSLYAFRTVLEGKGAEQLHVDAAAHKQFAQVTLVATHTVERTAGAIYTVVSDTGALDLGSLQGSKAVGLRFRIDLSSGTAVFRLPRQSPESRLTLLMDDGDHPASEFPLGEWILDSGYDWTAEDLDDILVDLDFSSGQVFIVPGGEAEAAVQPVIDL